MKERYRAGTLTKESKQFDHVEILYINTREREQFDSVTNLVLGDDYVSFDYSNDGMTIISVSMSRHLVKIECWNDQLELEDK